MHHTIILFLAIVIFACCFSAAIAVTAWALYKTAMIEAEEDFKRLKEEHSTLREEIEKHK